MADRTGPLVQPGISGPSGRTIVGFIGSYMFSYLLLGLFLVLEQMYAAHAYQAFTGAPGIMYIDRPRDGLYVIILTLMLFIPVALGGLMLGWITGRRSFLLASLLTVLYIGTGLIMTIWELPFTALAGWDIPSDEPYRLELGYYAIYLTALSLACTVPAAYIGSRIRNMVSPT